MLILLKKLMLLQLTCLSVLLLAGCAGSASCNSQSQEPPEPLLLFQKTPCYGTCPSYNATFYTDGSVRYEGLRHVPVQDTLQLCLPKKELKELQALIRSTDYTTWENSYSSPYTDLPATYITFYEQGREVKRVKHQQGGPAALQQLQAKIGRAHV